MWKKKWKINSCLWVKIMRWRIIPESWCPFQIQVFSIDRTDLNMNEKLKRKNLIAKFFENAFCWRNQFEKQETAYRTFPFQLQCNMYYVMHFIFGNAKCKTYALILSIAKLCPFFRSVSLLHALYSLFFSGFNFRSGFFKLLCNKYIYFCSGKKKKLFPANPQSNTPIFHLITRKYYEMNAIDYIVSTQPT